MCPTIVLYASHPCSDVLPPSPPHGNGSCMGPEDTWTLVERLTLTLVQELEPHKLPDVGRGLVMIGNEVTDTTDLEMVVPHLITLLGRDSKALKALKMVSGLKKMIHWY